MNEKVEEFNKGLKELCERLHVDFHVRDGCLHIFDSEEFIGIPIEYDIPKTESELARERSIEGIQLIIGELRIELDNELDEMKRKELEDRIEFLERNM